MFSLWSPAWTQTAAVYLAMAMVTVVKELVVAAMASMASPTPSSPFASASLKLAPSSSHAVCLRGSQPNPYFSRDLQSGSQPNLCLGRDLQRGSVRAGRSGALSSCRASSSSSSQAVEHELPRKLQEIVRVFQGVTEPRAKCEQLLHYASKLKPLAEDQKQPENKVEGCVSKVYIVCEFREDDGRVYFEAESDVLLTKGLAGLLVEGLSGVTVEEVLKVTPDFVHMLGLKQSLTPSRSNGFLNMLKLIQKKTLQVYSNSSGNAAAATVPITSINPHDDRSDPSEVAP